MHKFSGDIPEDREEELLEKPNVIGVGRGPKRTDGHEEEDEAVVVLVSKKLPEEELAEDDLVPESVDVESETVKTDVVDAGGEFYALDQPRALPGEPRGGRAQGTQPPRRAEQFEEAAFVGAIGPAQTRMDRWRPASAGVSIGHPDVTAGTLGSSPLVTSEDETVFLTNAHVAAPADRASEGDPILQPGRHDGGSEPGDAVGELVDWVELSADEPNRTDSALVRIDDGLVERDILGIPDLRGWANARHGPIHVKSGRTTGVTSSRLIARDVATRVNYGHPFSEPLRFADLDVFGAMSAGGDSGSVIGILRPDGFYGTDLLFAGSQNLTLGIPMETVQDEHGTLEPIPSRPGGSEGGALPAGGGPSAGQVQPGQQELPVPGGQSGQQGLQQVGAEGEVAEAVTPLGVSDPVDHFTGSLNPGDSQLWWSGSWDPRYSVEYYVDPLNPGGRIQSSVHSVRMDSNGRLFYYINVRNVGSVATRYRARYVYHWQ